MSPASAEDDSPPPVTYAKVTGYEPFSSDANKVGFWCKEGGRKISPNGTSWVVDGSYSQVIVKAGAGQYANTVFGEPPTAGQTVWADTNGDGIYNPGGKGGDKGISHIILCDKSAPPATTDLVVEKLWTYGDGVPDGFVLDESNAGPLTVTVADIPTGQAWGQTVLGLEVGAKASVSEGKVPDPAGPEGFACTIQGAPLYQVNGEDMGTKAPTFPLVKDGNTVVVTNSVDCVELPPTTSLKVDKRWVPGAGVPPTYPTLDSSDAGTLTVTVNGKPTGQSWDEARTGLPIGGSAVVTETKPTLPQFAGYECTVSDPTYVVNGGSAADSAEFTLGEDPNTVTVVNSFDCTALVIPQPPTTSITVTKSWVYVGAPLGYSATDPGALTVTVGGVATGQAWGATTSGHLVGAIATVREGSVPTPPQPADFECVAGTATYAVNGGTATTTEPSFALAAAPNTVTVTNTVTCTPVVVDEDEPEVGGVEDEPEVGGTEDEDGVVAGSESELADTGADLTGGLGAILVLAGAALIAARRVATR